jgi:5'-3' exonuclease
VIVDDWPEVDSGFEDPDRPIYWRHRYRPDYKGGRKSKPDSWDILTKAGYAAAAALGLPIVRERWMEADDLIAQYVRDREAYDICGLAIWTVDTDLLQLVTSDAPRPVVWYNTPYPPFYRDEYTAVKYWLKRWKSVISHPREIAAYKSKHGDSSDNLPPGTDIGIIDLLNPLEYPKNKYDGALLFPPKVLSEWQQTNKLARVESMLAGLGIA